MRFEALRALKMSMLVFGVTVHGFIGRYQRFVGTYFFHLQGVTAHLDIR
jgi:hypothetical protein